MQQNLSAADATAGAYSANWREWGFRPICPVQHSIPIPISAFQTSDVVANPSSCLHNSRRIGLICNNNWQELFQFYTADLPPLSGDALPMLGVLNN